MPLAYERDDSRRLITLTVTAPYGVDDVLLAIDRQSAEHTWDYAVLFDLHAPMLTSADSQRIAEHVKLVGAGRTPGPVCIAISADPEQFRRSLRYSDLSSHSAVIEVILTPAQRTEWLARNAVRRTP